MLNNKIHFKCINNSTRFAKIKPQNLKLAFDVYKALYNLYIKIICPFFITTKHFDRRY